MKKRQERLNELLRREISSIFLRELDHSPSVFVTITEVRISDDLKIARVGITIWPEAECERLFREVEKLRQRIQTILGKRLRVKPLPAVEFFLDRRVAGAGRVEELLKQIHNNS